MKKLFYLRHGLSELNVQGLFAGSTDTPLTEEGRKAATAEGLNFKQQGIKIDHIIASPLSRAHETAKLFAAGAGIDPKLIQLDDLLVERNFGSLESTTYSKEVSFNLLNDNLPDGVEKWDDVVIRAEQMLTKAEDLDGNVLFVAHGGIGRALKKFITDNPKYPHSHDWQDHIPNSTIVELI